MIDRLEQLAGDVAALHSKLIVILGAPGAGKSVLIADLAGRLDSDVLNVGLELGRRLAACAIKQRSLTAAILLRELADEHAVQDILLLDNIELLFDRSLRLDPLDLLKQLARSRRVVAVWPGEMRDGRLTYAVMGHPEHQDYSLEGLVPFEIH